MNNLQVAHKFAATAHEGQERKYTKEPYMVHPEETAQLLWEATDGQADLEEYIAALCHDVVEDTSISIEEIGREFGGKVMELVRELTTNDINKKLEGKKVYLTRKMNAMSESAFTIKLCDRLSNVVGLEDKRHPKKFVIWYVTETQYILEHLDREMNETQTHLTKRIEKMLMFLRLNRNL